MSGKKKRRISVFPKKVADVGPIILWDVDARLRHIEGIACGLDVSGTGALSAEEAFEGILRSMGSDWKADEEDVEDHMRDDMRGWWRDFPRRELLTGLYRRAARRKEGTGSDDSRRLPSPDECVEVAKALLADLRVIGPLDALSEAAAVSKFLADLWLFPNGIRSRSVLRVHIKQSKSNRVYFDALSLICEGLDSRDEAIPESLASWRREVAAGRRRRPARKPIAAHRHANPDQFARDLHIQFVIELLARLGAPPRGVSRCRIVAEASGLPEDMVVRIWKARPGSTSFLPMMEKHWKAIDERHRLH